MVSTLTRRRFTQASALTLAALTLPRAHATDITARTSVALLERDRILAAAPLALTTQPRTLLETSATIATLTAAFLLTHEDIYPTRIAALLATTPLSTPTSLTRDQLDQILPLAELARALSFLTDALPTATLTATKTALADTLTWLTSAGEPLIARDTHDHRASIWLLLTSALARSQRAELILDDCSHRLRKPTLRNQIDASGRFPQELATPNPFRNTLFNFDLLCGACQLLDTSPNSISGQLWQYELPDGPGLRSVAAALFPYLANPTQWPAVADATHFHDLPCRRPGLLFAGRAYNRPDYVQLWAATPPLIPTAIANTFPIREPLLWTTRAPHGL